MTMMVIIGSTEPDLLASVRILIKESEY